MDKTPTLVLDDTTRQMIDQMIIAEQRHLAKRHDEAPFSAWFMTVLDAARPAIRELTGPSAGW